MRDAQTSYVTDIEQKVVGVEKSQMIKMPIEVRSRSKAMEASSSKQTITYEKY